MSEPASAPPPSVVVVTPEQLATLIHDAVERAFAVQRDDRAPLLLDRNGIAKALNVGVSSIDRYRRAKMPVVWNGDSPRFEPMECLAWLKTHKRSADGEEPAPEERAEPARKRTAVASPRKTPIDPDELAQQLLTVQLSGDDIEANARLFAAAIRLLAQGVIDGSEMVTDEKDALRLARAVNWEGHPEGTAAAVTRAISG